MNRNSVIIFILLIVIFIIIGSSIFCFFHYKEEKLFNDDFAEIEYITYKKISVDKEFILTDSQLIRIRRSIYNLDVHGKCLIRHMKGSTQTIFMHMENGDVHNLSFGIIIDLFKHKVGVVEFDGVEYLCDEWMIHHFRDLFKEFTKEFH